MTATYLDYNATAPMRPEVAACMQALLPLPLNPSSAHSFGRDAKKHLENARKTIADAIAVWPNEIIFMGSGTEANTTALRGIAGRRLLVSAIEHSSILKTLSLSGRGQGEGSIPVTPDGLIDLAALDAMLSTGSPALVSVMLANNETGIIQPLREVSHICKKHGALLHTDAVQGLGKIPVDFGLLGVDMMTISAHKCGGPLGAAALVVRRDIPLVPLITGGGQELGRRAGTENVAAIAGFTKAVEMIDLPRMQQLRGWLDAMETTMEKQGATVFGKTAPRLPNTSCVVMQGVSNEVQLMGFDLKGFAVSAGSACSSGRIETSHVLAAMKIPPESAASAIRISAGWKTTQDDIIKFTEAWIETALSLAR